MSTDTTRYYMTGDRQNGVKIEGCPEPERLLDLLREALPSMREVTRETYEVAAIGWEKREAHE